MKKIKEVYKEVEEEKDNEIEDDEITMSREDFIDEHKKLIKILYSGSKLERDAEARRQEEELEDEIGEDD